MRAWQRRSPGSAKISTAIGPIDTRFESVVSERDAPFVSHDIAQAIGECRRGPRADRLVQELCAGREFGHFAGAEAQLVLLDGNGDVKCADELTQNPMHIQVLTRR